jgi:hypothetical protein
MDEKCLNKENKMDEKITDPCKNDRSSVGYQ